MSNLVKSTFVVLSIEDIAQRLNALGARISADEISAFDTEITQKMLLLLLNVALDSNTEIPSKNAVEVASTLDTLFSLCDEGVGIVPSRKLLANPASDKSETLAVYSALINFIGYRRGVLEQTKNEIKQKISILTDKIQQASQNTATLQNSLDTEKSAFAQSDAHHTLLKLDKEISDYIHSIAVSKAEIVDLENVESEICRKLLTTEKDIQNLSREISEENSLIHDLQSFQGLVEDLKKTNEKSVILKKDISDCESRVHQSHLHARLLEESLAIVSRASEMIDNIHSLNVHIVELNRETQIGNLKASKISDDYASVKTQHQILKQKISDHRHTLEIAVGGRNDMQKKISKATARLDQQLAVERDQDRKLRELQNRGRQEVSALTDQIGNFENKISSLPDIMKSMQLEHAKLLKISDQKLRSLESRVAARY